MYIDISDVGIKQRILANIQRLVTMKKVDIDYSSGSSDLAIIYIDKKNTVEELQKKTQVRSSRMLLIYENGVDFKFLRYLIDYINKGKGDTVPIDSDNSNICFMIWCELLKI